MKTTRRRSIAVNRRDSTAQHRSTGRQIALPSVARRSGRMDVPLIRRGGRAASIDHAQPGEFDQTGSNALKWRRNAGAAEQRFARMRLFARQVARQTGSNEKGANHRLRPNVTGTVALDQPICGADDMPARIPRPTRDRILRLHEDGVRIANIASELRLSRGTVGKYVREAELQHEVSLSPAAELTALEVAKMRYFLKQISVHSCPSCGERVLALPADLTGNCGECGVEWSRPHSPSRAASSPRRAIGRTRAATRR